LSGAALQILQASDALLAGRVAITPTESKPLIKSLFRLDPCARLFE